MCLLSTAQIYHLNLKIMRIFYTSSVFTHSALLTVNTQSKMALPCLFLLFFIINKTNTLNGWMSCWHEHEYNIHGYQYQRNQFLWDAHLRIADSYAQTTNIRYQRYHNYMLTRSWHAHTALAHRGIHRESRFKKKEAKRNFNKQHGLMLLPLSVVIP